jgi:hypothetical protein
MRALARALIGAAPVTGGGRGVPSIPVASADSSLAGTVVFVGLDLPAPGTVVGGHAQGAQSAALRWAHHRTAETRVAWGQAAARVANGKAFALVTAADDRVVGVSLVAILRGLRVRTSASTEHGAGSGEPGMSAARAAAGRSDPS